VLATGKYCVAATEVISANSNGDSHLNPEK